MINNPNNHSTESEKIVLYTLLRSLEASDEIYDLLDTEDFFHESHQVLFNSLRELWNKKAKIDHVLVYENLKSSGQVNKADHFLIESIMQLEGVSSYADPLEHTKIVIEKSKGRKLYLLASDILAQSKRSGAEVGNLLTFAENGLSAILERQERINKPVPMNEALRLAVRDILDRKDGKVKSCVDTIIPEMANFIPHIEESEYIIVAARTGIGKTAFGTQWALDASSQGKKVLMFSLEMTEIQVAKRVIANQAGINLMDLNSANPLSPDELRRMDEVCEKHYNIVLDKRVRQTSKSIASTARRMKRTQGLDLVVIDYVQLIGAENPKQPREEQLTQISRDMKILAEEIKAPVICMAQLNRDSENKRERPSLHHLRGSGALEQDANMVIILDPVKVEEGQPIPEVQDYKFYVDKSRNGKKGTFTLGYRRAYTRFESLEGRYGY